MDQHLNNKQNEILWDLLANPTNNGHSHAFDLQSLVSDFPQSGLLHALLSRSDREKNNSQAAIYFNPKTLYSLVNAPDSLPEVSDTQIIQVLSDIIEYAVVEQIDPRQQDEQGEDQNDFSRVEEKHAEGESDVDEKIKVDAVVIADDERQEVESINNIVDTEQDIVEPELAVNEQDTIEDVTGAEPEEVVELSDGEDSPSENLIAEGSENVEPITITSANKSFYEDELVTEAGGLEQGQSEEVAELTSGEDETANEVIIEWDKEENTLAEGNVEDDELITEAVSDERDEMPKDIDDDVYDEIVGIEDISFAPIAKSKDKVEPQQEETTSGSTRGNIVQKDRPLNLDDEAEKLIVGNIAATDYFLFDRAVGDRKQVEPTESESPVALGDTVNDQAILKETTATENQEVSKYHDDKMPYTFMWWLDKTRKEHAGIYQPFKLDTSQAIRQSGAAELQQQYYENIFHLNAVEELDRSTSQQTVEFDMKTKEDRIIKRFIVEEPHISPPSGDKLDTENKARRSAEDQDELVTETLARIYTDQMLYHKAI
ncbi:MAG: hypothetical protein JWP37_3331, partial [Mucilaginibacter sp.]|nr:hypothetical protein [Mucilaginibacter sp.]